MRKKRPREGKRRRRKGASGKLIAKDSGGRKPKEVVYFIDDNVASAVGTAYCPQASGERHSS